MTDKHLVIESLPTGNFDLEVEVDVKPKENTSLEGLYNSSGTFCTQCEAEGFRGITYFYDRSACTRGSVHIPVWLFVHLAITAGSSRDSCHKPLISDLPTSFPWTCLHIFGTWLFQYGKAPAQFKMCTLRVPDYAKYSVHGAAMLPFSPGFLAQA